MSSAAARNSASNAREQRVDLRIVQRDDGHTIVAPFDQHQFSHSAHPTRYPTRICSPTRCEPDASPRTTSDSHNPHRAHNDVRGFRYHARCRTCLFRVTDHRHDIHALMATQHGAAATNQVRESLRWENQQQSLIGSRVWRRDGTRVVTSRSSPSTWLQRVMVATLATRGVASHATAAPGRTAGRVSAVELVARHPSLQPTQASPSRDRGARQPHPRSVRSLDRREHSDSDRPRVSAADRRGFIRSDDQGARRRHARRNSPTGRSAKSLVDTTDPDDQRRVESCGRWTNELTAHFRELVPTTGLAPARGGRYTDGRRVPDLRAPAPSRPTRPADSGLTHRRRVSELAMARHATSATARRCSETKSPSARLGGSRPLVERSRSVRRRAREPCELQ